MKPDWKRILSGTLGIFFVYLFFVALGIDYQIVTYFESLPAQQAQRLGLSISLLFMALTGVVGFALARSKGRRLFPWVCVCFLLNVWAVIYLWSLSNLNDQRGEQGRSP